MLKQLGLSVLLFSGYQLEELVEFNFTGYQRLLASTDLLTDGEFDQDNIETARNWVGSTNQKFYYLTDNYNAEIEIRQLMVANEWRINLDGKVTENGLSFKVNKNKSLGEKFVSY